MKATILRTCLIAITVSTLAALSLRAELADSPEQTKPLKAGASVPDVTVKTPDGKDFALKQEMAGKPTVLIFYRGGWCPFCNRHLGELQGVEQELLGLGYQILAVSADSPDALPATTEKLHLTYKLLSDADMHAADAFGLAFKLDDATVEKYKTYGIKLSAEHDGHYWLPVPAVFVVDKDGKIKFAHSNPNYKVRISTPDLLKAAREAAPSKE